MYFSIRWNLWSIIEWLGPKDVLWDCQDYKKCLLILNFIDWASVENERLSLQTFTCSKSTVETLENVNMFKVNDENTRTTSMINEVVLVSLFLTLDLFYTFSIVGFEQVGCHCWFWTPLVEYEVHVVEGSTRTNPSLYFLCFHFWVKNNGNSCIKCLWNFCN